MVTRLLSRLKFKLENRTAKKKGKEKKADARETCRNTGIQMLCERGIWVKGQCDASERTENEPLNCK